MTAALGVAAVLLVIVAAISYWAVRARARAREALTDVIADAATGYEALGRASRSAAGGGSPESGVYCDEAGLPDATAFLGVVVDGIGDAATTERVRSVAVHAFLNALRAEAGGSGGVGFDDRMKAALDAAHAGVGEVGAETGLEVGVSLAAALIVRDGLHWISVGNSRIYVYRDHVLHQVTMDQTFVTLLARSVMREQLSPEEAAAKQERDALTSYVGAGDLQLDRSRRAFPLRMGDRVILCSKGVYGQLAPEEMTAIVASAEGGCSAALVERALEASSANPPQLAAIDFVFDAVDVQREGAAASASPTVGDRTTLRMSESAGAPAQARAG